jgi:hypothetical protein
VHRRPSGVIPRLAQIAHHRADAHITRAKAGEHQPTVYSKAHPELKIIQAMDVLLKNEK